MIRETGAAALLAISENDLLELSAMPSMVEGCQILTLCQSELDKVLDKNRTMEITKQVGILAPDSWYPVAADDIDTHIDSFAYPVVVVR